MRDLFFHDAIPRAIFETVQGCCRPRLIVTTAMGRIDPSPVGITNAKGPERSVAAPRSTFITSTVSHLCANINAHGPDEGLYRRRRA